MNRFFKYLLISVYFTQIYSSENRKLIALIDVMDDDIQKNHKVLKSITPPGPECYILRNTINDECAPIFVSKNIFESFYNFFIFADVLINAKKDQLRSLYGNTFSSKEYDYLKNIKTLVDFLLLQFQEAHNYINKSIEKQQPKAHQKINIAIEVIEHLKQKKLFLNDYQRLIEDLKLEDSSIILAESILTFYKSYNPEKWDLYSTKNDNYILFPKSYPADHFNKTKLYIKKPNKTPLIKKDFKDPLSAIRYEAKLLIYDLENFINNIPFEQKKPLDFVMIGHGQLGEKFIQVGGILSEDFQKLIVLLGQANTHTFFYVSCHSGGMTAKNVWFQDYSVDDDVRHSFQNQFTTIISPVTERAFTLFSPFWIRGWIELLQKQKDIGQLITKDIEPYIAIPNFKKYLEYAPYSLSKAISHGLYNPLKIIFSNDSSNEVSQLALIKFPGADWFSPEFLSDNVLEITKTSSAVASFEKEPIIQLPNQIIIAISTPIIYAPLVIEQTDKLRILSLLSQDSAYKNTSNNLTTYVKKMIIKDSKYKKTSDILKVLSSVNIAPCSVITHEENSSEKPLLTKNFFIEKIENKEGKILANKFAVTHYGTFFINKETLFYINSKNEITSNVSEKLKSYFNEVCESAKKTIFEDQQKNDGHIQTVSHKIGIMEKIKNVILKKMAFIESKKE